MWCCERIHKAIWPDGLEIQWTDQKSVNAGSNPVGGRFFKDKNHGIQDIHAVSWINKQDNMV